jgi:hypothetical protein
MQYLFILKSLNELGIEDIELNVRSPKYVYISEPVTMTLFGKGFFKCNYLRI